MMGTQNRTTADIIKDIKAKAIKASPMVKRVFFRGLEYKTKPELLRILNRMRVTREGDIDLR